MEYQRWVSQKILISITVLIGIFFSPQVVEAQAQAAEVFKNPPDEARPRAYWLWAHGNFDYTRIKEELKAFKEMGVGGLDIFDMGIADAYDIIPSGNPFMGDQMLDGIQYALSEAKKLDLKMGLSVSNGWNAGGVWTTPDEMIMRLLFWKDTVKGPITLTEIGFPMIPRTFEKPYGTFKLYPQFNKDGFPEYYEDVALIAFPLTKDGRIQNRKKIIRFDESKIRGNTIRVDLPKGNWVLTRAVVTPLGQKMWVVSDNSPGFIMDHYAKKATKHHFEHIVNRLEHRIPDLGNSSLERLYLASFEAEDYIIWSPELKEAFQNQHGYSLDPYVTVFAGQVLESKEISRRFMQDYRSTVSEMFVNNHYRQARDICHKHGILLASESGGPGPPLHYVPTEDLKALGSVDIMRGEFWNNPSRYFDKYGNDLTQVVKNVGSAAHIYGRKIVEMEAFTSHNKHWQESPLELKIIADKAFCQGMTRVVYHTSTHSPKEAGIPGWSYQAGTHISPKMAWWKLSKPFHDYLTRTSALLQMGHFVADVAYYYGEAIPNFAPGSKYIPESLGQGYDYDDLNKEVLLTSTVTNEGYIRLPGGMTYRLLVLREYEDMSVEVLEKLGSLLQQGAIILGAKPSGVPGLQNYQEREKTLLEKADKIWGRNPKSKQKVKVGEGILYTGYTERDILTELDIGPDFQYHGEYKLDYIHRASEEEDIYFVRNADSVPANALLHFRVANKQPYRFDPGTGEITALALFEQKNGKTSIPTSFGPWGSTFIVFSGKQRQHVHSVEKNTEPVLLREMVDFELEYNRSGKMEFTPKTKGQFRFLFQDGSMEEVNHQNSPESINITGHWSVRFPHGWGFDPIQQMDALIDWRAHPDSNLAVFGGIATYWKSFTIDEGYLEADHKYVLDLGRIGEVARVYLNGNEIGTDVFPPFQWDISDYVQSGANYLSIEVANTWINQLISEAEKPLHQQRTRSNVGSAKGRLWATHKPKASGLLGPVTIRKKSIYPIRKNQ